MQDVPSLLLPYDSRPSPMVARPSAPQRATKGTQLPVVGTQVSDPVSAVGMVQMPVVDLPPLSARALRGSVRVSLGR